MKLKKNIISSPAAFLWNLVMAYLVYVICRGAYLLENWNVFGEGFKAMSWENLFWGCFKFDTSAIFYTNSLYLILMLLPLHYKEGDRWQTVAKWVYLVINSLAVVVNLADSVYFQYTQRRTTWTVFQEFSNESNLGKIFGIEVINHWYLVLLGVALMAGMYLLYLKPTGKFHLIRGWHAVRYYAVQVLCFGLMIPLTIAGMRGGFTKAVRPITVSNANQYVDRPSDSAFILNTTFSMLRTIGKSVFKDPKYFTREELSQMYSPIHEPIDSVAPRKKNVVVLIMESFAREYIGYYNEYKGYTEFTDSLINEALTYEYTFGNCIKSIDGMPAILSSIPRFNESFFVTPASMNDVSGMAGELKNWGYQTAFFHGAENGSMGFEAFARKTGYQEYYGRTEYNQDARFHGDEDFDGTWAIWDEEFLQFFALKMSEMKEPFMTTVFTASSHHPYVVPKKYEQIYPDEPGDDNVIHKCIRYVDFCLKEFFKTASEQPWYKNTIFVLTADHTNKNSEPYYTTPLGTFCVPLVFFDPSGEMERGMKPGIGQQIDIMPTVLNYLGYDREYVSFGVDLLHTDTQDLWAVNQRNEVYNYTKGDYLLQMTEDGTVKGLYNFKEDWYNKQNLHGKAGKVEDQMIQELKAIIQDYMIRMTENKLIPENK